MAERLLFDASSLIYALKLKKPGILRGNYIQWLTIYETLNGLWKEAHLVKTISAEEATAIARTLGKITRYMNVLDPQGAEEEILKTALEHGITVYDASYIVLAKNNSLTLVTEDRKLRAKAEKIVKTRSLREVVRTDSAPG